MSRKKKTNPASTEVDAYIFIKANLKSLGWDTRNPEKVAAGQVWTQNECNSCAEIKQHFGLERPENVVKVTPKHLWVIEAKRTHGELAKAVGEAEDYARKLNASSLFKATFISGAAGNEHDSFLIQTRFLKSGKYVPVCMNGVEVTGLLTPENCAHILHTDDPNIDTPPIDERLFIARAERINEILHLGAVNPHERGSVLSALLLSKLSSTGPNIEEKDSTVLIEDINTRARSVLTQQKKREFEQHICIAPPASTDNHSKFRQALVDTIQELDLLNIRSAMNSGADWLGAFYEVFLKYANWAQDLGIVLTPRHVARWVADAMDIWPNDLIFDPTCGTGGFLVAGFDEVKRKTTPAQLATFKKNAVFGVEQDASIAALAVVNMIFRGDGKNNIIEGNCFAKFLKAATNDGAPTAKYAAEQSESPPITKAMMNPPFALKKGNEKEYKFIEQALAQMRHGGILFSVLPYPAMVKPGGYRTWRKEQLLKSNTLLSVSTFPGDLFYPVGVHSVGIFVRKGIPHPKTRNVLWLRAINDGLLKSKGKRLPSTKAQNDLATVRDLLRAFIGNPKHPVASIDRFQKSCPIDFDDEFLELVPENHLDDTPPTDDEIRAGMEQVLRDTAAFLIGERRGAWGSNTARSK